MGSADPETQINQTTINDLEKVFSVSPDRIAHSAPVRCASDSREIVAEGYCIAAPDAAAESLDQTLLKQIQQITQLGVKIEGQHLSRCDLAGILEGFAKVVRGEPADKEVVDRSAEIDGLRKVLVNAQDTIIKLLSEQVHDRAQIASLEARLKFLPDLQAQVDRALAAAAEAEHVHRELKSVRFELDTFRRTRLRTDFYKPRRIRSWWSWVCGRALSAESAND
ncbi:MAG: hypothetical protein L0Z53_22715 [Acidobacteriales bacterium]|nr:hypothetical protein [Terriglobales bacterium]